jgi:hypothetical protein
MQGHLSVTAMNLHEALPQIGIEGEMEGDSSFMLSGASLSQLAKTPDLDGTFKIRKGLINKLDLMMSATTRHNPAGDRTHFDTLSGTLRVENNNQHLRQLNISNGGMNANGSVDLGPDGQLSGRLSVELKMRPGTTPLVLSGKLAEPQLRPHY